MEAESGPSARQHTPSSHSNKHRSLRTASRTLVDQPKIQGESSGLPTGLSKIICNEFLLVEPTCRACRHYSPLSLNIRANGQPLGSRVFLLMPSIAKKLQKGCRREAVIVSTVPAGPAPTERGAADSMPSIRFHVDPRDVPASIAARRLGLSESEFRAVLPELDARGFPKADETTGRYDLDAIDEWRRRRHPHLFLTSTEQARESQAVVKDRLKAMRNGRAS